MMRLAVLDLDLGAFHVDLFEVAARGAPAPLVRRRSWSEIVRLGFDVPGQRLGGVAFARGLAAAERLLDELRAFDAGCPVLGIAGPALRAADDGPPLCEEIGRRHRAAIELLSDQGAARLSYLGAAMGAGGAGRPPRTVCREADRGSSGGQLAVVDLGSWSLALATGRGGECELAESVPIGLARLRAVHVPPGRALDRAARERVAATVRFAAAEAARAIWDRRPDRVVVAGGAAGALAALADELGLRPGGDGGHGQEAPGPAGPDALGPAGQEALGPDALGPGPDALGLDALRRLADVLGQFRPVELPGLGIDEASSDAMAVAAVALHTILELVGAGSAAISTAGRREGVALGQLGRARPVRIEGGVHSAVT
jgi:exopolyphosphatase/pppGpp-phosphohydrolase